MDGTDIGAYIQTAQSCAVKIVAIVEAVGRHPTKRIGCFETFDGDVEVLPPDRIREPWLYLGTRSGLQWGDAPHVQNPQT